MLPAFRWGSDFAGGNWWAYYNDGGNVFIDTGVPFADDAWYNLAITRDGTDGKVRYYLSTGTAALVLVATSIVPLPSAFSARRFFRIRGGAGAAPGDGGWIDFFKRCIER